MATIDASVGAPWIDEPSRWVDQPGWDRAQALLMLLPAAWLAWPGFPSPISRDFLTTELTATGAAAIASLPAAGVLFARVLGGVGFRTGASIVYLGVLVAGLVSALVAARLDHPLDPLERTRALLWMMTGWIQILCGLTLKAPGRRALVLAAAAIALLLAGYALLDPDHAGALHNSGELSNAALPGALAGATLLALSHRLPRWLGAAALLAFLAHGAQAPVLAGPATVAIVGLGAGILLLRARRDRRAAPFFFVVGVVAGGVFLWARSDARLPDAAESSQAAGDTDAAEVEGERSDQLDGLAVRRRVWFSTLAMVSDAPVFGVGTGQFAVYFPPYRDPFEIELSSHERTLDGETEVEQPHNEYLLVLAEGGLVGALAWGLFWLLGLRAAWNTRRAGDATTLALATGVLGLFIAAAVNAPFSFNPTASVQGFAFLGALMADTRAQSSRRDRIVVLVSVGAFALPALVGGVKLVRHGVALASISATGGASPHQVRNAIDGALRASGSSVTARSMHARFLEETGAPRADLVAAWEAVLELRPYRVEALVQLGALHAQAGEHQEARALFDQAAELDPRHPALMRNRARLELFSGQLAAAEARLEDAIVAERADALWLRDIGTELLCHGREQEAMLALSRAHARFRALDAALALQIANEYRESGSGAAADGFECLSNRMWAREHADALRWDDARRMMRQAIRFTRDRVEGGAPRIRLELAATMWRSFRQDEARQELEGMPITASDWRAVPEWTRVALEEAGFEPEE